jgi:hypothetical protein
MKTFFLNILVFTTIFVSCDKDETTTTTTDELYGEWSLVENSKGFGGYETFEINDIIWKFNSDNTINVTLNVTPDLEIPLGITGVYEYTLDGNQITLPDGNTFEYTLLSDGAILRLSDNGASDGDIISFEKL